MKKKRENGIAEDDRCVARYDEMRCENRSNVCVLGDVNPVCYRHRLPAISGPLFKVLVAGLGGAFSGIWPASS